jgi:hypothetical protein
MAVYGLVRHQKNIIWTSGNCYAWSSGVIVAIEKPGFFGQNIKIFMISKFSKFFKNFSFHKIYRYIRVKKLAIVLASKANTMAKPRIY